MVRKAEGFLTEQGKFFNTEDEAKAYEAGFNFNAAIEDLVAGMELGPIFASYVADNIRWFVISKGEAIREYIHTYAGTPVERPHASDFRNNLPRETQTRHRGPVIDLDQEPENDLQAEFIQAFEDPVREADSEAEDEGADEETRLDELRTSPL